MKSRNLNSQRIKYVYTFIFLTFLCFSCVAQTVDKTANENTTTFENNTKLPDSPCSFSGSFNQTKTVAGLNKNLESSGSFFYHCQDGVIWSTTSPINETLIFSRAGNNTQIKEQKISKLKGRQGKLLGKLLNTMMSGNQSEIMQQFSLNTIDAKTNQFELLPKKKSLKRAIKEIKLTFTKTNNSELISELDQINIQIRDRKDQLTSIESTQTNIFDTNDIDSTKTRHNHCLTSGITTLACDQLYLQAE